MDEQKVALWVKETETGYTMFLTVSHFENENDAVQQGAEILAFIEAWEGETLH